MEWLRKVVLDPRTERFIMAVIIANAVVLGLETSKTAMASYGRVLETLDHIMLAIFVVELTARIAVYRWAFFKDPWSVFDFIVTNFRNQHIIENQRLPVTVHARRSHDDLLRDGRCTESATSTNGADPSARPSLRPLSSPDFRSPTRRRSRAAR